MLLRFGGHLDIYDYLIRTNEAGHWSLIMSGEYALSDP